MRGRQSIGTKPPTCLFRKPSMSKSVGRAPHRKVPAPGRHITTRSVSRVSSAALQQRLAWRRDAVSCDAKRGFRVALGDVQQKNAIFLKFFQKPCNFNDLHGHHPGDPAFQKGPGDPGRCAAGGESGANRLSRESPRLIRPAQPRGAARRRKRAGRRSASSARITAR